MEYRYVLFEKTSSSNVLVSLKEGGKRIGVILKDRGQLVFSPVVGASFKAEILYEIYNYMAEFRNVL